MLARGADKGEDEARQMPQATQARASIVLAHHMTAPTPCERNSLCSGRLTLRCAVLEPARRGAAAASALLAYAGHDREARKHPRGKEDERRTLSDDATTRAREPARRLSCRVCAAWFGALGRLPRRGFVQNA